MKLPVLLTRTSSTGCECRRDLTCVSSKRGSHDVVAESGEAKMEACEAKEAGIVY